MERIDKNTRFGMGLLFSVILFLVVTILAMIYYSPTGQDCYEPYISPRNEKVVCYKNVCMDEIVCIEKCAIK